MTTRHTFSVSKIAEAAGCSQGDLRYYYGEDELRALWSTAVTRRLDPARYVANVALAGRLKATPDVGLTRDEAHRARRVARSRAAWVAKQQAG